MYIIVYILLYRICLLHVGSWTSCCLVIFVSVVLRQCLMYLRLVLNFWTSWYYLLGLGITGMHPTPWRGDLGGLTQGLEHARQVFCSLNCRPSPLIDWLLSFSYSTTGAAWHIHAHYVKNLLPASVWWGQWPSAERSVVGFELGAAWERSFTVLSGCGRAPGLYTQDSGRTPKPHRQARLSLCLSIMHITWPMAILLQPMGIWNDIDGMKARLFTQSSRKYVNLVISFWLEDKKNGTPSIGGAEFVRNIRLSAIGPTHDTWWCMETGGLLPTAKSEELTAPILPLYHLFNSKRLL